MLFGLRRSVASLRARLIAAFLVATLVPLGATIWITMSLLERSLGYATTEELDALSRTLEATVRRFYERERQALERDAKAARLTATSFDMQSAGGAPEAVRTFWESGEAERFSISGAAGDRLDYMTRAGARVDVYSRELGGIRMQELGAQLRQARELIASMEGRDLRRGFTLTLLLLVAVVWLVSLAPLLFMAHRISRPIQELTAGLTRFSAGDWDQRLTTARDDEVGRAVGAFNDMAEHLRRNRERLVYLAQVSSWETLARKTAHELKNSLTPIRLTVEEMVARQPHSDREFMQQAAQIVIGEIETLERRVRAFSEFASEPPLDAERLDLNAIVGERVALLKRGHPETTYRCTLDAGVPAILAGADLVKGILTNLLENAAEAAGPGGTVEASTHVHAQDVAVEVHDSGPGLSEEAVRTLFEPTITFKKHGMGLGLSIAKKNALRMGGDIALVEGRLGGAGFRVILPRYVGVAASLQAGPST
jgi:two-component system, NtrC family, nitrogen regulation sensor histidine kinase NtrY